MGRTVKLEYKAQGPNESGSPVPYNFHNTFTFNYSWSQSHILLFYFEL